MFFKDNDFFSFNIKKWRDFEWFYIKAKKKLLIVLGIIEESSEFIIIKQYRPPIENYVISLPMGAFDTNEAKHALDLARIEAEAETGYKVKKIYHYMDFARSPGLTDEMASLYIASYDFTQGEQNIHECEEIEVLKIPHNSIRNKLEELYREGYVLDSSILVLFNISINDILNKIKFDSPQRYH